jgi:glycosyltransferase involved in cell wall biosynthesis
MSVNCPTIEREPQSLDQTLDQSPTAATETPAPQGTVVHFCLQPDGGVWTHIRLLSEKLRPRWRTAVVAVSRGTPRGDVFQEAAACTDRSLILSRPTSFGSYYRQPVDVTKALAELGIDPKRERVTYHFHTGPSTPFFFKIPATLEGSKFVTYHGSLGNFRDTGVRGFPRRLFGIAGSWWMRRRGFEFIAVSRRSAEDCAAMYLLRESTFRVAYCAIAGNREPRQPRSADESGPFHIGFLGTIQPGKGWERVIEATRRVRERGKNVLCTIAGDGHDSAKLQEVAAQNSAWLRAPGRVKDPAQNFLPNLDVVVLPSDFEGLPLVLPEAMSCGVPCICTDVGGCAEAVRDSREGFVLRRNCSEEIADDIVKLIDDRQLWLEFSRNGRRRYEEVFTPERMVETLEGLYTGAAVR